MISVICIFNLQIEPNVVASGIQDAVLLAITPDASVIGEKGS